MRYFEFFEYHLHFSHIVKISILLTIKRQYLGPHQI